MGLHFLTESQALYPSMNLGTFHPDVVVYKICFLRFYQSSQKSNTTIIKKEQWAGLWPYANAGAKEKECVLKTIRSSKLHWVGKNYIKWPTECQRFCMNYSLSCATINLNYIWAQIQLDNRATCISQIQTWPRETLFTKETIPHSCKEVQALESDVQD